MATVYWTISDCNDKDIHNIKVSTTQNLLHKQLQVEVRVILGTSSLHHSFGLFNEYKQHDCSVITDRILIPAKSLTAQYHGSTVLPRANVKAM